jgi:hypothetical protein
MGEDRGLRIADGEEVGLQSLSLGVGWRSVKGLRAEGIKPGGTRSGTLGYKDSIEQAPDKGRRNVWSERSPRFPSPASGVRIVYGIIPE